MVVEQDTNVRSITELVTSHIPEGKVSRSHGMELSYTLPLQDTNKFPGKRLIWPVNQDWPIGLCIAITTVATLFISSCIKALNLLKIPADLFQALEVPSNGSDGETVAKKLGIQTYGVSMTTLEEVFLKLNDEEKDDEVEGNGLQAVTGTEKKT